MKKTERNSYAEIVTHGNVTLTEKEVIDALFSGVPDLASVLDRPEEIEGQLGWDKRQKITIHMDGDELILGYSVTWYRDRPAA